MELRPRKEVSPGDMRGEPDHTAAIDTAKSNNYIRATNVPSTQRKHKPQKLINSSNPQ